MKKLLLAMMLMMIAPNAWAQAVVHPQVDLILPPSLASADAPFYRGAKVKIDDRIVAVQEGDLASGQLAEYQAENGVVMVSNSTTASEISKGQALLDVVTAMQLGTIDTAAGQ